MKNTHIKTFRADSLQDALNMVRNELGPSAEVLHAREIEKPRLFGLFGGGKIVELTAIAESSDANYRKRWDAVLSRGKTFPGEMTPCKQNGIGIVAMIGPNGAGKTSLIAKLCVRFRHLHIGMITLDTSRPGANKPLVDFANALAIPVEIVLDVPGMYRSCAEFIDCDMLFIDTPGIPYGNDAMMDDIGEFLDVSLAGEVQLVLPASMNGESLARAVRFYSRLAPNSLSITKIDETPGIGHLLPVFEHSDLPLRYVSESPSLSGGIEPACADYFLRRLTAIGGSNVPANIVRSAGERALISHQ